MLRDLRVTTFTKHEGLSEDTVESVLAARDGTVWIGSNHLQALIQGTISPDLGKGLPGNYVTSLLEDHTGRLWAGMDSHPPCTCTVPHGTKYCGADAKLKAKCPRSIAIAAIPNARARSNSRASFWSAAPVGLSETKGKSCESTARGRMNDQLS
jgi:hypothetical protein